MVCYLQQNGNTFSYKFQNLHEMLLVSTYSVIFANAGAVLCTVVHVHMHVEVKLLGEHEL